MRKVKHSYPKGILTEEDIFDAFLHDMQKSKKAKFNSERKFILSNYVNYVNSFSNCSIHTSTSYANLTINDIIIGNLTRKDFQSLYEYYLREKDNGRFIYDYIKSLVKNICPYCDISEVSALDHFLPISAYPQYATFSFNLIASCTLCNTNGKSSVSPTSEDNQIIHSYLDNDCFFNEKWINARFLDIRKNEAKKFSDIDIVEYFIDLPEHWQNSKKEKAKFNFELFNLSSRFGDRGNAKLSRILKKISKYINPHLYSLDDIIEILDDTSELPINHWESILYHSLLVFLNKSESSVALPNLQLCPRCENKWKNYLSCDVCNNIGLLSKTTIDNLEAEGKLYHQIECPSCILGNLDCDVCKGRGYFQWENRNNLLDILKN